MTDIPYSNFSEEKLILRDYLAIDRTILANERTYLAYIRTALALFIAGVSFINFFDSFLIVIVGWMFIPLGVVIFFIGSMRYKVIKSQITGVKK